VAGNSQNTMGIIAKKGSKMGGAQTHFRQTPQNLPYQIPEKVAFFRGEDP